ncbi:MAG: hypothetical protein M1834_006441 [Cirrosporium novae-zelandiae]|nr:MAG: hypothetical protein M1834_006441 [Cirrosporium novae-zelandiae]
MFNFTSLLGAQSPSAGSQSLLELDGGVKILIDVGWDEAFDVEKLRNLEREIPTLSIILLTHATPAHLAAFAHCCKHFPLFTRVPIYATNPVISLGRTFLQDLYASAPLAATLISADAIAQSNGLDPTQDTHENHLKTNILLPPPTAEEIAAYFSLIHPLKYSQPHQPLPSPFSPPLNGLTITAYNAGHSLGGTIWHIQLGMESIIYAVDWNQAKENVLAGAAWFGGAGATGTDVIEQLRKPTALVCSSSGAERAALSGGRNKRDDLLLDHIRTTVSKGGTVLIPTDTSGRALEIAYILEHEWRRASAEKDGTDSIKSAEVYFASKTAGATMRYAKSMLEWMDDSIVREFETDAAAIGGRSRQQADAHQEFGSNTQAALGAPDGVNIAKGHGPLDFKHLQLVERRNKLEKAFSKEGPKVILASDASLEWGFSKDIIKNVVENPNNLIVLTEHLGRSKVDPQKPGTSLGEILWSWYEEREHGVATEIASDGELLEQVHTGGRELVFRSVQKQSLDPAEQMLYQQYLATQIQLQAGLQGTAVGLETSADAVDEASSSSSSSDEESDSEQQGKALNFAATLAHSNRHKLGLSNEELGVNVLLRRKGVYDYDVRGKKGREKIFPFVVKRRRADDFGELIRPEEYLRAEERDEIDGQDMKAEKDQDDAEYKLGQKRKWGDVGVDILAGGKRKRGGRQDVMNPGIIGIDSDQPLTSGNDDEDMESEEENESAVVGPSKAVFETITVTVHSRLAFVDFQGIHDQRSLQMLIPLIQPRKLVLTRGTKEETLALAEDCQKLLAAKSGELSQNDVVPIFTPALGETVDASVDTNAWTVKLTRTLANHLHWQNVRGLGVVTLTGQLAMAHISDGDHSQEASNKKPRLIKNEADPTSSEENIGESKDDDLEPVLDVLPPGMAAATRSIAQPLHVGDLRLADLRKLLQSSGHTAEFRGEGTLLIDGLVAVRKTATGRIEVEGGGLYTAGVRASNFEGTFFAVKRKIYEGLAVVAGG